MAVPKKDQERVGYASLYGAQASKDGKERVVPAFWHEYADAWLQGYDGVPMAGSEKMKPVSEQMEAEVDEAAVGKPQS
ncbi:hypothetical protein DBIPINDM_005789 [Mesorhizobium sp. AR02]|uniref:hypothetical protein n=1 Tax=Mesorhizobium sp. AR02 TaxID=2865837 RepID=UPI00215FEDEE|nr:hypothetical protein [Mesorhizobium sp. AR02]UVK52419.1 hypothetical protein DBIPINDM_005789 [Mesorhizobium sp. AR02]